MIRLLQGGDSEPHFEILWLVRSLRYIEVVVIVETELWVNLSQKFADGLADRLVLDYILFGSLNGFLEFLKVVEIFRTKSFGNSIVHLSLKVDCSIIATDP